MLEILQQRGWKVRKATAARAFPPSLLKRYVALPTQIIAAICSTDCCIAPDDKSWLLCLPEILEESDSAFKWDEFELMSIEAAGGDVSWLASIKTFWDLHFPVWMSVAEGYAFAAVDLSEEGLGTIVYGREPDFEETEVVAQSYSDFIAVLAAQSVN